MYSGRNIFSIIDVSCHNTSLQADISMKFREMKLQNSQIEANISMLRHERQLFSHICHYGSTPINLYFGFVYIYIFITLKMFLDTTVIVNIDNK